MDKDDLRFALLLWGGSFLAVVLGAIAWAVIAR